MPIIVGYGFLRLTAFYSRSLSLVTAPYSLVYHRRQRSSVTESVFTNTLDKASVGNAKRKKTRAAFELNQKNITMVIIKMTLVTLLTGTLRLFNNRFLYYIADL
jgi:hypothetical protein